MREIRVVPWGQSVPPSVDLLTSQMQEEGLAPVAWSNAPLDRYQAHKHDYDKVIYVALGSIVFTLPGSGEEFALEVGDKLELPAGTLHGAIVGQDGVTCLEAHVG